MKKKLLVSFSGGETSAFMAQWLLKHKSDEYEMLFVFANTGQENEQTLEFIEKCSKHFGINIHWIEAVVNEKIGEGTRHKIVDFYSASRMGEPFEDVIKKYGIPNTAAPFCTRELKASPIKSFGKEYFGTNKYELAIGIRIDEIDRMNNKRDELRIIYPLIKFVPTTKLQINEFWKNQPFRLELKGYQGNCKTCWKKSFPKLYKIASEDENNYLFFKMMEEKYGNYLPDRIIELMKERGDAPNFPITFFRNNKSANDIIELAKKFNKNILDDSRQYDNQIKISFDDIDLIGDESCEVFSECGDK